MHYHTLQNLADTHRFNEAQKLPSVSSAEPTPEIRGASQLVGSDAMVVLGPSSAEANDFDEGGDPGVHDKDFEAEANEEHAAHILLTDANEAPRR